MNLDPLESLLREADESAGVPVEPSANLADRVLSIHTHRRKRNTRAKLVVGLVGCYAAGVVTAWVVLAVAATGQADLARSGSGPNAAADKSVIGRPHREPDQEATNQVVGPYGPTQPGVVVERSRYELFRQLGDESHRRGDLQTAVSYYSQALDAATDVERVVSYRQDNWLLITLKRDRLGSQMDPSRGDSI